mmetsp:Transcript_40914/g.128824  ORF Transcript_40914/g.128824 Transcript_40914/m.128824 type:complete len:209 (+) Transcript_40914:1035-1661(+)
MLSCSGLTDDPFLAQTLGEESLSQSVVDLVGSSVSEALALEPNLSSSHLLSEVLGEVEGGGSSDVLSAISVDLLEELWVIDGLVVALLEIFMRLYKRLGDVPSSELSKGVRRVLLGLRNDSWLRSTILHCRVARTFRELRDQLLDLHHTILTVLGVLDGIDDRRANDSSVSTKLAKLQNMLSLGDSEANGNRNVRVLPDPGEKGGEIS